MSKFNLILFFFIFSFGSSVFCKNINPIDKSKCSKNISTVLDQFKSSNDWRQISNLSTSIEVYRTPTRLFGQWIEYHTDPNNSIFILNSAGIKKINFDAQTCEEKNSTLPEKDLRFINSKGPRFTDSDLLRILQSKQNALIYVYTPKMTYSIQMAKKFQQVAEKLNLRFIPLVASDITKKKFQQSLGKTFAFKYQRLNSIELTMRETQVHFPTSLIIYKGQIIEPVIRGVMESDQLEFEIKHRLVISGSVL